ncbi:MAG TPA: rRNA maturation RNase YbeY [Desulfobacteraceae bacterium]|nr:rRNA maturation RNase YbeY [Desulfobacteraceae bacterium]
MDLEAIRQKGQVILKGLDFPDGELSILIVDDNRIAELNREYLKREGPTNVIAFSMMDGPFSDLTPNLLGDVVISVETAVREGNRAGIGLEERFMQLLIHGILHIFGYDHEKSEKEAEEMEKKSVELLKLIGLQENSCGGV